MEGRQTKFSHVDVRQGWRGGEDQDVRTCLIHIIVVKKKGNISVDHLYTIDFDRYTP
jgi:hypothetical protein